jgi:hypothetical protein
MELDNASRARSAEERGKHSNVNVELFKSERDCNL